MGLLVPGVQCRGSDGSTWVAGLQQRRDVTGGAELRDVGYQGIWKSHAGEGAKNFDGSGAEGGVGRDIWPHQGDWSGKWGHFSPCKQVREGQPTSHQAALALSSCDLHPTL